MLLLNIQDAHKLNVIFMSMDQTATMVFVNFCCTSKKAIKYCVWFKKCLCCAENLLHLFTRFEGYNLPYGSDNYYARHLFA